MSDIGPDLQALANPDEAGFIVEPSVDIFVSEESKQALVDYLATELDETSSDAGRTIRMQRNTIIKRQRLARPESETKDFPWENASNVSPPLALQKTNSVVTRILNKLTEKDPLIKYEAIPAFKANADAITRFIQTQLESPYGINLYSKLWGIVYDTVSLGTKFIKVPFTVERMKFKRKDGSGAVTDVDRIIKSSPDVVSIPMEDFLTRPHWTDIQKAPWIAVRYYKFKHELEALAAQGFYTNVDAIITETGQYDIHKEDEQRLLGVESSGTGDDLEQEMRTMTFLKSSKPTYSGTPTETAMQKTLSSTLRKTLRQSSELSSMIWGLGTTDVSHTLRYPVIYTV